MNCRHGQELHPLQHGLEETILAFAFNVALQCRPQKLSELHLHQASFISVVGTIQKRLLTELANGEKIANGFIDRILFAMTKSNGKPRWNEDENDDLDRGSAYSTVFFQWSVWSTRERANTHCHAVHSGCQCRLYEWQHENAALCDNEMSEMWSVSSASSKIYVLRLICLILRIVRAVKEEPRILKMTTHGSDRIGWNIPGNAISVLTCISEEKPNELHAQCMNISRGIFNPQTASA